MKIGQYILSLDQGTTSSRAVLFDALGGIAGMGQREFTQIYPQPGYVEHDAVEILQTQLYAMRQAVHEAEITAEDIAAISITNQRETTVAWDSETGIPICNAIVGQCRRTAPECERLKAEGLEEYIHKTTGLIIDPYFSGTKMKWILDNVPKAKVLAKEHRLRFGTIDTWLIYSLTEGESYVTDVTNASRTMLFDIDRLCWDERLCAELGIPSQMLPRPVSNSEIYGCIDGAACGIPELDGVPVCGCSIPYSGGSARYGKVWEPGSRSYPASCLPARRNSDAVRSAALYYYGKNAGCCRKYLRNSRGTAPVCHLHGMVPSGLGRQTG